MQLTTIETRAHDNILWKVSELIGTSDYFNWQHESHEGHVLVIEHCKKGGDLQVFRLKHTGNPDPQYAYHKVSPFYRDKKTSSTENRPHYICPIEIKVTQGDINHIAEKGLQEATECRATNDREWQFRMCIAVKFKNFNDLDSFKEAVCFMTQDYMKTIHIQWRVKSLIDFKDMCRKTIPQICSGYIGHIYKKPHEKNTYIDYDEPPLKLIISDYLMQLVEEERIQMRSALMLRMWIHKGVIYADYASEFKSVSSWAEDGNVGETKCRQAITMLSHLDLITVKKKTDNSGKGRGKDMYSLRLGRGLFRGQYD